MKSVHLSEKLGYKFKHKYRFYWISPIFFKIINNPDKSKWESYCGKYETNCKDFKLKEVWKYRDLIWLFTKRSFVLTYKQTVLGPLWLFISPIMTSLIYTFVFGGIAGIETDGVPQILFYMGGNAIWTYFSSTLTKNANAFTANASVFGKVYFPRLVVPIAVVISNLLRFVIQAGLFVALHLYFFFNGAGVSVNWTILLTPIFVVIMAGLGLGFGILISSMTTKYRDLALLVSFGVHLWMYATPVAYPASLIAEKAPQLLGVYMLNPMTPLIELFRSAYLGSACYYLNYYWLSIAVTIIVFILGVILFSRVEKTFMDTV
jgi:lipopolysaccharide transport system permease protein